MENIYILDDKLIAALDFGDAGLVCYILAMMAKFPIHEKVFPDETETSAYAVFKDGNYRWGNVMLSELSAKQLESIKRLNLNFKAIPGTGNDEYMSEFAKMIFKDYKKATNDFRGLKPVWFIGCPSSWHQLDGDVKRKYSEIFRNAGMEEVHICEESVAAFAYYDRSLNVATGDNVSAGILLIDWGSSTLDATFIYPKKSADETISKIDAIGCMLGAHFIDKAIVNTILHNTEKYGLDSLNSPELTRKVARRYETDEMFQKLLNIAARKLKEDYFNGMSKEGLKPKEDRITYRRSVLLSDEPSDWGEGETEFKLGVSIKMMNDILNTPIKEIVPDFDKYNETVRNDIGNDSFIERNDRFLQELSTMYPAFAEKEDALLVLTGGASQMGCMREAVSRYFPKAKLDYDRDPQLSIGKGLAYYGREALKNKQFEDEFEEIGDKEIPVEGCDEPLPQLLWTLYDCYTDLAWDVTSKLQIQCAQSLYSAAIEWKNSKIDCDEISSTASKIYSDWAEKEMDGIKKAAKDAYTAKMREKINAMYTDFLKKHGIKVTLFEGEVTAKAVEILNTIFDKMVENDIKFLVDLKFGADWGNSKLNRIRLDLDALFNVLVKQVEQWNTLEFKRFTDRKMWSAFVQLQYEEVKKEIDSKKEGLLWQLGLVEVE